MDCFLRWLFSANQCAYPPEWVQASVSLAFALPLALLVFWAMYTFWRNIFRMLEDLHDSRHKQD